MLINCTPVGMHPNVDETPDPPQLPQAGPDRLRHDLHARNDAADPRGPRRGCHVITGVDMFVRQAACNSSCSPARTHRGPDAGWSSRAVSPVTSQRKNESTPVFLIGYRGSGKTTVARLLAEILGWHWLDADARTRSSARQDRSATSSRKTASPPFAISNQPSLRNFAASRITSLATGGGVVLAPNRARIKQAGQVVWLKADAATLWRRMRAETATGEHGPIWRRGE